MESSDPLPAVPATEVALEQAAAAVRTEAQAEALLHAMEHAAQGLTEEQASHAAPTAVHALPTDHLPKRTASAADTLLEAARQAAGSPAAAESVNLAVEHTLSGARPSPANPRLEKGRSLLRTVLLRELSPLRALDTMGYLAINNLPHPKAADRFFSRLSWVMTGGGGWFFVLLAGFMVNRRRGWRATLAVAPALWLATSTVEHPIKRIFRRRRPFISLVRAIVVGRKPGSFSFPSGHSAAAAAGAVLLSRQYPGQRGLFRLVAALVCFSRIYLGAHYPGDVITGAGMGAFFARFYSTLLAKWQR